MLTPVHDAHDDGACFGGDLDQVETGFAGSLAGFIERNDADLLAVGTNESDGAQTNLLVDADLLLDQEKPPVLKSICSEP
jgi:hypothetical protein